MATVSANIATIVAQAEILDDLISQFRSAAAIIAAAEKEIRQAQPGVDHAAHAGRARISYYAHAQMVAPDISGDTSVTTLATDGWAGVS